MIGKYNHKMCQLILSISLTYLVTIVATPVNNLPSIKNSSSADLLSNPPKIGHQKTQINFSTHQNSQRISATKCDGYSREIVWIMPLSKSKPIPISIDCATPINPLITGGEIAKTGEFPHMAAIGWLLKIGEIGYHCGATLVSDRWVLTAAHCTHHPTMGNPSFVKIGSNRLSDEKSGQLFTIDRIERHPDYMPPRMYADVALLKLSRSVTFTPNVKPACLDSTFNKAPIQAWVTGWGSNQFNGHPSDVLLKAKLDIVDNVHCTMLHNFTTAAPSGIVPSMLCAGDPNGEWKKDTCQGDSGGPLQAINHNSCIYNIIGVTSFGRLCATPDSPGVYTRVSHYLEWIEAIVWPEDK